MNPTLDGRGIHRRRAGRFTALLLSLSVSLTLAAAAQLPAPPHSPAADPITGSTPAPEAVTPALLAAGQQLFARRCAPCHGPAGEGGRGPTLAVPRLLRAPDRESLLLVIRRGIADTEMPGTRLSPKELQQLSAWVLHLGQQPQVPVPGDARRGEFVYAKGGCASCHAIAGHGGAFGPDLTDIGRRRSAAHLRTSLVEPEAYVPKSFSMYRTEGSLTENFLQVRVVTRDGQQLLGARVNEDTFSIQFRDIDGRLHSFDKRELTALHKDWGRSPMPSYRGVLSDDELTDVVAFLASLRDLR